MLRQAALRYTLITLAFFLFSLNVVHADAMRAGVGNSNTLGPTNDGSSGPVSLGFNINFLGQNYSQVYVNNNGNVTFNGPLSTFTPFNLTTTGMPIIAPFFADVDTRAPNGAQVTFGQGTMDGHNIFAVNWDGVGFFNMATDRLNQFQMLLIDRSDTGTGNFDIEFNYDSVQWETGQASGGDSAGQGGDSARVGWANGEGAFAELAGSGVNGAFLNTGPDGTALIFNSLNSGMDGRYIWQFRNDITSGDPDPPGNEHMPEPFSLLLFGGLLGGACWYRRRMQSA